MTTIVGIDPGTRFIGIAVVRNGVLIHRQLRSFQGVWSLQKLKEIIHWLDATMKYHGVTHVAIKIPDVFPTSLPFNQLIGTLNVFCGKKGIKPEYHSLSEITARHCKGERKSRAEVMAVMVRRYPELMPEYTREQRNENAHYYKLFIALAAAHMQ